MEGVIATNRACLKNETTKVIPRSPFFETRFFNIFNRLFVLDRIRKRNGTMMNACSVLKRFNEDWDEWEEEKYCVNTEGRKKKKKVKDRWSENGTIFTSRCDRIGIVYCYSRWFSDSLASLTSITNNIRWCALFHARKIHLCKGRNAIFHPGHLQFWF